MNRYHQQTDNVISSYWLNDHFVHTDHYNFVHSSTNMSVQQQIFLGTLLNNKYKI